ncbi:hypothetical protein ACN9MU_07255 [Pseudoduganella sp. R-32]|uniref:hypothetical protein n=1 Tax=Pseudoduganella sp. R-32 TaxID=3404061 RepID=UPI003CE85446
MATIEIINEPRYSFGSSDNARRYSVELDLSGDYRPSSAHGVMIDGDPVAVIGAGGGATGVHSNTLLEINGCAYVAVGPYIVCFGTAPFEFHWSLEADSATCFGLYYHKPTGSLISHGELEIARFNSSGKVLWSASGADIFTEGFSLQRDHIEVVDFNGEVYHFGYDDGHVMAQPRIPADASQRR